MYIALDDAGAKWLVWGARCPAAQSASAANLSRFYGAKRIFLAADVLAMAAAAAWILIPNQLPANAFPLIVALLSSFGALALGFRKAPTFVAEAAQTLDGALTAHLLINGATLLCVVAKIAVLGAALFA